MMKSASISLAESKWAANDIEQNDGLIILTFSRKIMENVNEASEVVEVHVDNVAGVKLPVFKSKHREVASGKFCLDSSLQMYCLLPVVVSNLKNQKRSGLICFR